ncbi:MAG: pseudouridine synthase [Lachnospiraceae bacterium]|nr:pseudouridine synthase [Lachnospiraceae bacterium]
MEEGIRINKYLCGAGICSRREADRCIAEGRVTFLSREHPEEAEIKAEPGQKIREGDRVFLDGREIRRKEDDRLYLILNKPRGIICTGDRRVRENIIDYAGVSQYVSYAGRLDKDSTGLVLLTNDGMLNDRIMRAANGHEKEYIVRVDKCLTRDFLEKMKNGVTIVLDDDRHLTAAPGKKGRMGVSVRTRPCRVLQTGKKEFSITLTQGYNRQIRRMCRALGYTVLEIQRIRILNLRLGDLKEGMKRVLTRDEVSELKRLAGLDEGNSGKGG